MAIWFELQMDILVLTKTAKMVATRHTSLPQNIQKCFGGWAVPWTPLGKLTALPGPSSSTWWPRLGGEGKGG